MSANYWEQIPALTPLQFYKPYQPAYEEKLKTIQAQTDYWKEGARQVSSVLDKANDLSLITENKDRAQNFEKEADNKIVSLTKNNLAVNGVAAQALNVYAPLFNDVDIRQEDGYLKNESGVLSKNESEKTREGGKNYDPTLATTINSKMAIMKRYNKRDAWKLVDTTEYSPYYDKTKERNDFIKNNMQSVTVRDQLVPFGNTVDKDGKVIGNDGTNGVAMARVKNADIDYNVLYNQWQGAKSDKYKAQEKKESDAEFWSRAAVLKDSELAGIYEQKANQSYQINKRYVEQEIANDGIRMSRETTESDKKPLQDKIASSNVNLQRITEEYQKNLGSISEMKNATSNLPGDLGILKRLNFLANGIDNQYNNTQFALNNSYQNNSTTYINAPENFQIKQRGIIAQQLEITKEELKIKEEAAKAVKKGVADGKAPQEYQMLFNDGYESDGKGGMQLTPNALRYNQAVNANIYSTNYVGKGIEGDATTKESIYTEQKNNIATLEDYSKRVHNTVTSALFGDNKGVAKTLMGELNANDLEPQDLEAIRDKTANIHFLQYKQLNPEGKNTLESFKNFYKNSTGENLVASYNNRINSILQPDEDGHVNSKGTEILAQGLSDVKQKQLSENLFNQEVYYIGNTIKNLRLTSDALKLEQPEFYKFLEKNNRLTTTGRLKADTIDEDLKAFLPKSEQPYLVQYTGAYANQKSNFLSKTPLNTKDLYSTVNDNSQTGKILNSIKEKYFTEYSKPVENVSEVTFRLEDRNDNEGKGTADDINKKDYSIQRNVATKLLSNVGTVYYKNDKGNLVNIATEYKTGDKEFKLGDIFKKGIQEGRMNLDAITIQQDVIDQNGPNKSNVKELTVKLGIDNLLNKPSGFRDDLEAAEFIEKVGNDFQFKDKYKNLNTSDGIQFKVSPGDAAKSGLSNDYFEKRSPASAAIVETGKGAGVPITVYDKEGKSYNFRIKNSSSIDDPQFRILDLDGSLKKLGANFSVDNVMQGIEVDLRNAGYKDYTSKTIGDNISQRFINLWYANINKPVVPVQ